MNDTNNRVSPNFLEEEKRFRSAIAEISSRDRRRRQVSAIVTTLMLVLATFWLTFSVYRVQTLSKRAEELNTKINEANMEINGLREALAASRDALVAFHQRNYDTAVLFYDKALNADPNNAYLLNLKAYSLFKLKRLGDAIKVQQDSLRVDPSYEWGYFDLARFQCAAGKFEDAKRSIQKAIEERPSLRDVMDKDGEFQKLCGQLEY